VLAVSVGLVLKSVDAQLRVAVELLSRRCENLGRWSVVSCVCVCAPDIVCAFTLTPSRNKSMNE